MRRPFHALLLISFVPPAAFAGAGGVIHQGDVYFTRDDSGFDGSPAANLTGASTGSPDNLFAVGWWYRISGDIEEHPFPVPTVVLYPLGGDESSIDWDNVAGAFDAHEESFVNDAGSFGNANDGGYVTQYLSVSNLSGSSTLHIAIFHYVDFDLDPNSTDDSAFQPEWATAEASDTPIVAGYWAKDPDRHQMGDRTALLNALNDTSVTTLSNGVASFGPGDFAAANQWNLVIPPNGSAELKVVLAVNTPLRCGEVFDQGIFCDPFESQSTGYWSP